MPRRHRITVAAATAAVLTVPLVGQLPASAADSGRVAVPNAQPDGVRSAKTLGHADTHQRIQIKLYLANRHRRQMVRAMHAVTDPQSKRYTHYMSPAQFRSHFSPTKATVSKVRSFLEGNGLDVTQVPANRSYVAAAGTVAQVQKALSTSLKRYRLHGHKVWAAANNTTVPRELAGRVVAVSGVASRSTMVTPSHEDGPQATHATAAKAGQDAPPPDAFVNAPPCSDYYGQKVASDLPKAYGKHQPYAPCGYVPDQLQGAYGLTRSVQHGLDGSGVTVAITDAYAAPTILDDANTYATTHGQPAFGGNQFRQVPPKKPYRYGYGDKVNGDLCGEQGWYGEETLDVEAVHGVAPGANVTYVPSRSCDNADFAATLNKIVDRHLADIVTNSWGGVDESNGSAQLDRVYQQIFYQAALEGIGFYFSSGDAGDGRSYNNGTPTVEAPANSPLVTAVGGTSLAVNKRDERRFETGWSTSKSTLTDGAWTPSPPGDFLYGAGGGTSRVFSQPWYQQGVVPNRLAERYSSQGGRVVPDISAVGDPTTGMLVGETQTFPDGTAKYSEYRLGGTSLSSPLMAGMMAVADQVYGHPHGFANPAIYDLYGSKALYDPTNKHGKALVRVDYANGVDDGDGVVTSLRTLAATNGTILRTRRGYDDITGVGTPNGEAFLSSVGYQY